MNPNIRQVIEDEESGREEFEEDIDYDALYGGLDIDISPERSESLQNDYAKVFGDVAKQGAKEFLIGAGGAYGDLLELAPKSPAIEARNRADFEALDRLNDPSSSPSFSDLYSLSDEGISLEGFKLPTSENLRSVNDAIGGPGEAETQEGRYAARIGRNYGASVATGNLNPLGAIASGVAGQTVEEREGGPLAQAAAEIVGLLVGERAGKALARKAGRAAPSALSSGKKSVQDEINNLRQLGYSDEDITLAINSAYKNRSKLTSKGSKTEKAFENFSQRSDDIINDILSSEVKGYEKGSQYVKEIAQEAYGQMLEKYGNLQLKNLDPFVESMDSVLSQAKKVIGNNSEGRKFISELSQDVLDIISNPSAEDMVYFYQRLNGMGKWVKGDKKDRLITMAKDSIKDSFKRDGVKGRELAEDFEKVNKGIQRSYRAADVRDLMDKASTQKGLDYNKLSKVFDKPENVKLFEEVLGPKQAKNIQQITKLGKEVKDFDKAWKGTNAFSKLGDVALGATGTYYFLQGDWEGLAKSMLVKGGKRAVSKLVEKSLTDPKLQNLMIRGLHAVKTSSPRSLKIIIDDLQRYVDKEGIDIEM